LLKRNLPFFHEFPHQGPAFADAAGHLGFVPVALIQQIHQGLPGQVPGGPFMGWVRQTSLHLAGTGILDFSRQIRF
jgi:hypothetical protein